MDKLAAGDLVRRESILEVRVNLVHSEPSIWRQLEIRGSLALHQVHQVLQAAFDWEDAHLHRFTPDDPFAPLRPVDGEIPQALQWLPGQDCEEPGDRPEEDCTLDQLLALGSGAAFYEYDFGDSWLHRLKLLSRRPTTADTPPVRLIDGARRGPLEDFGGLPGYEEITVLTTEASAESPCLSAKHSPSQGHSPGHFAAPIRDIPSSSSRPLSRAPGYLARTSTLSGAQMLTSQRKPSAAAKASPLPGTTSR